MAEMKKKNQTKVAKMSNEIKQMIKYLKSDWQKLSDIQKKNQKKKSFTSKAKTQQLQDIALKQLQDVELCFKHIVETEELDKRRFKRDDKGANKSKDKDRDELLEEAGDEEDAKAAGGGGIR